MCLSFIERQGRQKGINLHPSTLAITLPQYKTHKIMRLIWFLFYFFPIVKFSSDAQLGFEVENCVGWCKLLICSLRISHPIVCAPSYRCLAFKNIFSMWIFLMYEIFLAWLQIKQIRKQDPKRRWVVNAKFLLSYIGLCSPFRLLPSVLFVILMDLFIQLSLL